MIVRLVDIDKFAVALEISSVGLVCREGSQRDSFFFMVQYREVSLHKGAIGGLCGILRFASFTVEKGD